MKTYLVTLWTLALGLWTLSADAQTPIVATNLIMTGSSADTTLNIKALNNPIVWQARTYRLPQNGTNFNTVNGVASFSLVPGRYIGAFAGIPQSFQFTVTNSATPLNLVDLIESGRGVVIYSGVETLTGAGSTIVIPPTGAGGNWIVSNAPATGAGLGNVTGPLSSQLHHVAAFANTSGQLLEDTGLFPWSFQATNQNVTLWSAFTPTAYSNGFYTIFDATNSWKQSTNNNNLGMGWVAFKTNSLATNANFAVTTGIDQGAQFATGANGTNSGASFGYNSYGANNGAGFGFGADGGNDGAGIGQFANGDNHGFGGGESANGSGAGTSVGAESNGSNLGTAVGNGTDGHGEGNVAIGSGSSVQAVIPDTWTYTLELGAGTATLQGGLNFRGFGLFDTNGFVAAARLGTNDATASDGWALTKSGGKTKWVSVSGSGTVTSVDVAQSGFTSSGAVTGSGTVTLTRSGDINNLQKGQTNISILSVSNSSSLGGQTTMGGLVVTNGVTNLTLTASTDIESDSHQKIVSLANAFGVKTNDGAGNVGYNNKPILDLAASTNLTGTNIVLDTATLSPVSNATNYTAVLRPGLPGMQTIITAATNVNLSLVGTNLADVTRSVFVNNFTSAVNCNVTFTFTYATNYNFSAVVSNGWAGIYNFWNADTTGTNVLVSDAGRYHR